MGVKKPSRDFLAFQKEFLYWQEKLGCTGYKCYFKHAPIDGVFADITTTIGERVATVRLNSKLPDKDREHRDVRHSAKHEAVHLMLRKLEDLALNRYLRDGEVYEAVEELTFKLEKLL